MGVLLAGDGVEAPPWPHVICAGGADVGGRGYAWHDDERRRACFAGVEVAAPAPVVAAAIDGRELAGVDRLLAIARLKEEGTSALIRKVFRHPCPTCGENHHERAEAALRAIQGTRRVHAYVHPGAIEHLRRARVPEQYLYQPRFFRPGVTEQRSVKHQNNLPVIVGEPERTRLAQIAFAHRYEERRARPAVAASTAPPAWLTMLRSA